VASTHLYQRYVGFSCQNGVAFDSKKLYGPRHVSDIFISLITLETLVPTSHSTVSSSDGKDQVQYSPPFTGYLYWMCVVSAHLIFEAHRQDGQPVVDGGQVETK
jgi:hypothetical protein